MEQRESLYNLGELRNSNTCGKDQMIYLGGIFKKTSHCGFMLLRNTNFSYDKCASLFLIFYLNECELVYATANCSTWDLLYSQGR